MKKFLWTVGGVAAAAFGIAGIFLPLLPTIPFLLIALFCFSHSKPKWKEAILQHSVIGKPLREFQQYKGIRMSVKIYTVTFLWLSILTSVLFLVSIGWVRLLLLAIAVAVTIHVLSFRTIKTSKQSQ